MWDNQVVNNIVAMDWSAQHFFDWRKAEETRASLLVSAAKPCQPSSHKWIPPKQGAFKLNVDAAVKSGSENFFVGLILCDHLGQFVIGKVVCMKMVSSVFEAEACAIQEGLQWLLSLPHRDVEVKSDSLLSVQALKRHHNNHLEVGFILDSCRSVLFSRLGLSISFAKSQANKTAHLMARISCLLDCQSIFMSPPDTLVEKFY